MKTALVIIDVQNVFITPTTKNVPQHILTHLKKKKYSHIIFTQFVNKKNSPFVRYLRWNKAFSKKQTDIVDALKPLAENSPVFRKSTYSIFESRPFLRFLKKNHVTNVELAGMDIDSCVLASGFGGFDKGFKVTILTRLCGSADERYMGAALPIISRNLPR